MPVLAKETCLFPETLLESCDSSAAESQWMVVYTKPRQEKSLARELLRQTVPFYLPLVKKTLQYGHAALVNAQYQKAAEFLTCRPSQERTAPGDSWPAGLVR